MILSLMNVQRNLSLEMVDHTSILPREVSFMTFLRLKMVSRLNSGENGLTRGKAVAFAFVPGFTPLRRMN